DAELVEAARGRQPADGEVLDKRERRAPAQLPGELLDHPAGAPPARAPAPGPSGHERSPPAQGGCAAPRTVAVAQAPHASGDDDLGGRFRSAHRWWLGYSATVRQPEWGRRTIREMVGARGFEPPTSRSRTVRATRLRYAPIRRDLFYRLVGLVQGRQASQAYLPTSLTNLHSPQGRVFISPPIFSTTVRGWLATSPMVTTMRPPSPSF